MTPEQREQLVNAIVRLTDSPTEGDIVMTRTGDVRLGKADDPETLQVLMTLNQLARQLGESGLYSYTEQELRTWAELKTQISDEVRITKNEVNEALTRKRGEGCI